MRHKRVIGISLAALMLVSLCAVCASTSAAAKDSEGAPANGLDSGTAVCSWGAGRLDVFAKGTNGNLWHKWFDGSTWQRWEDLGSPPGGLYSNPTAVSWDNGRIDVFVRDHSGYLWQLWFDGGWHPWNNQGIPAGVEIQAYTAPAASSWGPNRLDVFIVGDDGQLWQKWFDGTWHNWVSLGQPYPPYPAVLSGSPGAVSTVSWGYHRIDIFIRGSDGALYQKWFDGAWHWWKVDGTENLVAVYPGNTAPAGLSAGYYGFYYYAPAICSWGANRLDVFFVDTSGHLQQKWFDGSWHPIYNVGGTKYISAGPSAVAWQNAGITRIDIFTRRSDFALYQLYFAGGWNGWYNLGLLY